MITSANVWGFVWLHIGVLLTCVAYFTVSAAMMPNLTSRGAAQLAAHPVRTILIGLAISGPWVGVCALLANITRLPALQFIGVLGLFAWILIGLIGGAAAAWHVGQVGADWRRVVRGGCLLVLTWALPFIGWFVMYPLTLSTGIGCFVAGMIWRGSTAGSSSTPPAPPAIDTPPHALTS